MKIKKLLSATLAISMLSSLMVPMVFGDASIPVVSTITDKDPNLVAFYRFDDNLDDSSGKGHNGSEEGALGFSNSVLSGKSLKLDAEGYMKVVGADTLNLGEKFTINAWIKMSSAEKDFNRYNTVIFKENPAETSAYIYKAVASGTHDVRLDLGQLSSGFEPVVSTSGVGTLGLEKYWSMITWVCDGEKLYIYIDGKLNTTGTTGKIEYGVPFADTVASNLYIGGPTANSAELFNGQIDEMKVFSRVLTAAELKAEYDALVKVKLLKAAKLPTLTTKSGSNSKQLAITAVLNVEKSVDVTKLVTYKSSSKYFSVSKTGFLKILPGAPKGNAGFITVEYKGKTLKVPVVVK